MIVWPSEDGGVEPQDRDERNPRQNANLPGVRHQLWGEGVRGQGAVPCGPGLRGNGGWGQTYLGGRAQEGLLRLDGFE